MAHYAKVTNGKVVKVIVADASFFNNFIDDSPGKWVQTSYNTRGGVHYQANSSEPSPTLITMIINDSTSSFADEDTMHSYTASLLESFETIPVSSKLSACKIFLSKRKIPSSVLKFNEPNGRGIGKRLNFSDNIPKK